MWFCQEGQIGIGFNIPKKWMKLFILCLFLIPFYQTFKFGCFLHQNVARISLLISISFSYSLAFVIFILFTFWVSWRIWKTFLCMIFTFSYLAVLTSNRGDSESKVYIVLFLEYRIWDSFGDSLFKWSVNVQKKLYQV